MNVEEFLDRLNDLYLPPENAFTFIDVPEIRYAAIEGRGNPESEEFEQARKWLFSIVHVIKPVVKKRMGNRYAEPPLEYLFWGDNDQDFISGDKDCWNWRVMIAFIDWITDQDFYNAVGVVEQKLGQAPVSLQLVTYNEGKSVQITHIGDYSKVPEICSELYEDFLPKNGLHPAGPYHEIYLNDPNRTAPAKRRMVIRQPVS